MISTLSKQGGRRYPQMGSTGLAYHGWLPGVGGSVTPPIPPVVGPTATPGFPTSGRVRDLDERPRYESDQAKRDRRIREGTLPAEAVSSETSADVLASEYAAKSARLAASIAKARAEAEVYRREIARLEAAQVRRQTEKLQSELLRAQQALQLATVQEAVFLEEMEVMDVAYVAMAALSMVLQ